MLSQIFLSKPTRSEFHYTFYQKRDKQQKKQIKKKKKRTKQKRKQKEKKKKREKKRKERMLYSGEFYRTDGIIFIFWVSTINFTFLITI